MTEIHERAVVCPQCNRPLSFLSSVGSFLKTTFWVIAKAVSVVFASLEKIEKYNLAKDLDFAFLTNDTLSSELVKYAPTPAKFEEDGSFSESPGRLMASGQSVDSGAEETDPTELLRIDETIAQLMDLEPRDETKLKKLILRREYLKSR